MKPTATTTIMTGTDAAKNILETQDRLDHQLSELKATVAAMEVLGKLADARIQELKLTAGAIQAVLEKARQTKPARAAAPQHRLAFSLKEAAGMLGVSPKSMYRLIQRGLLRPSLAFRTKLVPLTEIERFLKETTAAF